MSYCYPDFLNISMTYNRGGGGTVNVFKILDWKINTQWDLGMRILKLLDYSQMMKETIYSMTSAYIFCQL